MGKSNAIISAMEDTVRKSLLRVADPISGCSGGQNDFGNLEEIGKLLHLEDDFGNLQKDSIIRKISKMWLILSKKQG